MVRPMHCSYPSMYYPLFGYWAYQYPSYGYCGCYSYPAYLYPWFGYCYPYWC